MTNDEKTPSPITSDDLSCDWNDSATEPIVMSNEAYDRIIHRLENPKEPTKELIAVMDESFRTVRIVD